MTQPTTPNTESSPLDDLYQPSISSLQLDEMREEDRPVIYLDDAKAVLQAQLTEARRNELEWLKKMSDHRVYKEGTYYEINGKHVEYRLQKLTGDHNDQ